MRKIFMALLIVVLSLLGINLLYPVINQNHSSKSPASAYEWYRQGKEQDIKRDFSSAEKSLKKALAIDPNLYKAMLELGVVYTQQGDFIKARPFFEKALLLAKNDKANYEIAYFNLGLNYMYENDSENAWKYLVMALDAGKSLNSSFWSKDPTDPEYFIVSGDKLKFYEMAKKYYSDYIRDRIKRIQRASIFQPALALKDCENYILDNPGSKYLTDIIANKAWLLSKLKEYDKANAVLNSLNTPDLRDDLKQWTAFVFYCNLFSAKHYELAFKQADYLHNQYPGLYSKSWLKYQKALIYHSENNIISEKIML